MNKQEFLSDLANALSGLPPADAEDRIAFYGEMIDDRMEEGTPEEEAVAGIGTVEEIRAQILADVPLQKLVKEKMKKKRRFSVWEIVLLILGFPLWFPLLLAGGAVLLALYLVVWALILSLWAIEISLWASALAGVAATAVCFARGAAGQALMMLGAALFLAGLSVFLFFACVAASKGVLRLTKKAGVGVKSMVIGKEKAR